METCTCADAFCGAIHVIELSILKRIKNLMGDFIIVLLSDFPI